jgi:hypothetical protein
MKAIRWKSISYSFLKFIKITYHKSNPLYSLL